jgi:hypothetical protein
VAALTGGKVITAKSTLAVVARLTTLSPASRMMIERLGCSDLATLRHSGSDLMTFVACHFAMLCVTEIDAKGGGKFWSARVTAQLMTRATGGNVPPSELSARCVALVTGRVSIEAGGN